MTMKYDYNNEIKDLKEMAKAIKQMTKKVIKLKDHCIKENIKDNQTAIKSGADDIFANSDLIDLRGAVESINDIDNSSYSLLSAIEDLTVLLS